MQESEEEYDPKDGGNIKKNGQSAASVNPHFLFKGSLRSHMNLSNTGSFNCHICKYAFKEKTKLTKHIKLLHSLTEENISDGEDLATEMSLSLELLQESEEEYDPIDNGNTSDSDEADVQQVPYQE